jgi:predicted N-acetyltransferase YhbS
VTTLDAAVPGLVVRSMEEGDLAEADRIVRLAFGTFLGLPDPMTFMGDAQYIRTRWTADPTAAFVAELNGEVVGSNFATNWGSVGFFGPLSVRPDLWDRGVAQRLLVPTMDRFRQWGTSHNGLFTFPHSTKHIHLYQKFGFWPRFLTPIMAKPVVRPDGTPRWARFSEASPEERERLVRACRELTSASYPGLDVEREIRAAHDQRLGDTVLLWDGDVLVGVAVCHVGAGSEAGSGACYIKFGAVRPGAAEDFARLLDACETLAAAESAGVLIAGVNVSHHDAYRQLLVRGFRTELEGVVMQQDNAPGYHRPDVYVLDDWR